MKLNDLTGRKFGALVVAQKAPSVKRHVRWQCICSCGKERLAFAINLLEGHTKSCGCGVVGRRSFERIKSRRVYSIWRSMLDRCLNKNNLSYSGYGGRGITVCVAWLDFEQFQAWAERSGYRSDLTLDRRNNDGNYMPANCRWADRYVQANNTRKNIRILVNGVSMSIAEAARAYGLLHQTVRQRLQAGWSVERALTRGQAGLAALCTRCIGNCRCGRSKV